MKVKIRDNQKIKLPTGETITRNLYSEYVSNSNPVWCRYRGTWYLITNSFEPFEISHVHLKMFNDNERSKEKVNRK